MWRLIVLTFAFLAVALYELSGGSEFQPAKPVAQVNELEPLRVASIDPVLPVLPKIGVQQAPAEQPVDIKLVRLQTESAAPEAYIQKAVATQDVIPSLIAPETSASRDVAPTEMKDIREVTGRRVNMRQGPGTQFNVVSRLVAGENVEVLQSPGNGWLKLKVVSTGRVGWMADWLVSEAS